MASKENKAPSNLSANLLAPSLSAISFIEVPLSSSSVYLNPGDNSGKVAVSSSESVQPYNACRTYVGAATLYKCVSSLGLSTSIIMFLIVGGIHAASWPVVRSDV